MKKTCPQCRAVYVPVLYEQDPDTVKDWRQERTLIQHAFPHATDEERDQLVTGICSDECYRKFLGPEE